MTPNCRYCFPPMLCDEHSRVARERRRTADAEIDRALLRGEVLMLRDMLAGWTSTKQDRP